MGNKPKASPSIPLVLPIKGCWELEESTVDSVHFFQALWATFPEATTLFFEGTAIAPATAALLRRFGDGGKYLPLPQTISPPAERFSCAFSLPLCAELAAIAEQHAEPELCDHLFVYSGETALLEWPDAFYNCMWVASEIPEGRVARFASALGLRYRFERVGQ